MNKKIEKQDVMDFIVRFERYFYDQTGKEGIYPNNNHVALALGVSRERVRQIKNDLGLKYKYLKIDKVIN